jgi:hypothetical protein
MAAATAASSGADSSTVETRVAHACFDVAMDRVPSGHAFFDGHVAWIPWPESAT